MSVRELKRQARHGNIKAARVYSVRGVYRVQLLVLLWGIVGLSTAVMVLLLENLTNAWVAVAVNVPLLVLVHAVLPWSKRPKPSLNLASALSPALMVVLGVLKPLLSAITKLIGRWIDVDPIGIVHSKDELLEILRHSEMASRVSKDEVLIATSALTFGDENIGSVMTPIGIVKTIKEKDVLTPIMLDELHDSGFSRFPVRGNGDEYVGTLYFKDAVNMQTSHMVKDIMRKDVFYVNESALLDQALKAFLKTQHHLFMVVNEYEDVVGVITIEDILERIIGKRIVDEFDKYDDLRAVARTEAQKLEAQKDHI
jgi:metal transporter CNNM